MALTTLPAVAGEGGVDTTFNVVVNGIVNSIIAQANGEILIGGGFTQVAGVARQGVARLFPDGTVDTNFVSSISSGGTVDALLLQPDGRLLVGGNFGSVTGSRINVMRVNPDGSVDGTFTNSNPSSAVLALGLQANGQVLIGGQFFSVSQSNHNYIARLNADGTVDNTFTAGAISGSAVNAIAVQADGNILIGGAFGNFTTFGLTRQNIARLTTNGTPDLAYQPTASGTVQSVFLEGGGKSVWGGAFGTLNSTSRQHVGRLNVDGSLDGTFTAPVGANGTVFAVTEDANNNIYVAGTFTAYNNQNRPSVARVFADGTLDTSFASTTNFSEPTLHCLAVQSDGRLLAGGNFNSFNGVVRTNLARLYGNNYPAEITTQPAARNVAVGTNVTFSVDVSNPSAVSYQWSKNGAAIPGATFGQYTLFNVQLADAGTYSAQASTGFGGTTSSNALLQVGIAPVITQPPTNVTVAQGDTAVFSVTATGTPLNYFWKLGTNVVGTNSTLTLTNVQPSQGGTYVLVVSNFVSAITNPPVFLVVQSAITSVSTPANQTVVVGGTASFTVTAVGSPRFYQWLANSNPIAGATAPTYTLTNVMMTDAGNYSVIVSNQFNALTSLPAVLTVGLAPQTLTIHENPDTSMSIQMSGTPGFNYVAQTSSNLQPPAVWQSVATLPADTNGVWTYLDTNTASAGARFYRVSTP